MNKVMICLTWKYTTHLNIYNFYQMAGYTDYYTQQSFAKLQEWNLVPDYKIDEYIHSSD